MRWPPGLPRLTRRPLRTMNGEAAVGFLSRAGTSACQPARSWPLKRGFGAASASAWDAEEKSRRARVEIDRTAWRLGVRVMGEAGGWRLGAGCREGAVLI